MTRSGMGRRLFTFLRRGLAVLLRLLMANPIRVEEIRTPTTRRYTVWVWPAYKKIGAGLGLVRKPWGYNVDDR